MGVRVMQAAYYERTGAAAEVLLVDSLPDPEPGPGEVRVRVHLSAVNPTDWKARAPGSRLEASGGPGLVWPRQIPGQDGAGIIDSVGSGVDPARIGERVWVYLAAAGRAQGTAAEYVSVPQEQAKPLPDAVGFEQGAGIGIPFITAHRCVHADGDVQGQTVLVTGGAGAVGHAAVQLARLAGARVVATVSSVKKAELATAAGAHVVLDYTEAAFAEQLADATPDGIQRVVDVDLSANFSTYVGALEVGATVASYATDTSGVARFAHMAAMERNAVMRFVLLYTIQPGELHAAADDINAVLGAGDLRSLPATTYPLEQIAEAHDAVQAGTLGRVLVEIP